MKPYLAMILLVIFSKSVNSQTNADKIDSVFRFYFFVFEMETSNCCPSEKYPEYYYYVVNKKTDDTIYLNKYSTEAAEFMQKISNIKYPIFDYEGPGPVVFAINPEIVSKWKTWYSSNRNRLKWSKKRNRPVLKKF